MHCRFENRIAGTAHVLSGLLERITARSSAELPEAFARIESARKQGLWVALLLDYELGEWLEPSLTKDTTQPTDIMNETCRLTALVFDAMNAESPWDAATLQDACIISVQPEITHEQYIQRIRQIREWIAQGEVYQINTTFPMRVSTTGRPQALYRNIASQHPVAFAAYIEDGPRTVLSFSPELFLQRTGTTLVTRPMKGTAPRATDQELDIQLGLTLQHSVKNRAENLMIVDLLRNDLGRIALPGSVRAAPLFSLEKYPSVWTMTSTVQAEIPENTSLEKILTALFPCGSVTGAPKIAAMKRIQQTEPKPRGLYCGSVGWLAPNGDFSLNVAIRTLILDEQGQGTYHVGGGIVHDSSAEEEWQECHWKSRVLAQAQPSLIETMLADAQGSVALLNIHLDRMENSARALNFKWPGRTKLTVTIAEKLNASNNTGDRRVRLLLSSDGNFSIETAPLAAIGQGQKIGLSPIVLDSQHPLLHHKTTFRPWYVQATTWLAENTDYFDLIFLNEKNEICEGSRSNIFIKKNGVWITPALSSGVLEGVYRRHLIAQAQNGGAEIKVGTLTRADLEHPNAEIRLSNALRGWFDVRYEKQSLLPGHFFP